MIEIRKIMFPTDFTDYSQHALKYALTLAENFKARLIVMHAWEVPTQVSVQSEFYSSVNLSEVKREEENSLNQLARDLKGRGVDVEPVFVSGRAYMEIVRCAQELDVDLIALATHGRKGLSHLVFGSTAEKVVRLALCPVLTVKHPEHDFVK